MDPSFRKQRHHHHPIHLPLPPLIGLTQTSLPSPTIGLTQFLFFSSPKPSLSNMDPSFGKQRHHDLPIPQSIGFGHRSSHGQDHARPKIRRRADCQHVSWEEEEE